MVIWGYCVTYWLFHSTWYEFILQCLCVITGEECNSVILDKTKSVDKLLLVLTGSTSLLESYCQTTQHSKELVITSTIYLQYTLYKSNIVSLGYSNPLTIMHFYTGN